MDLDLYNVAQAFDDVVARYAHRTALAFTEEHRVTYRQLDTLSNQIAQFMLSKGIRKGDRIALSLEKSATAYALILAALKVGAIYVALDPRNPATRRDSILAQCTPSLLFIDGVADGEETTIATVECLEKLDPPQFCQTFSTDPVDTVAYVAGSDPAWPAQSRRH